MKEISRIGIYHKADFDGIASGAIIQAKYPETYMIPYDYGEPLELPKLGVPVIMADISLPMDKMRDVGIRADGFTWIDHHKSAIDAYEQQYVHGREVTPLIEPVLKVGTAACELTWKHLFDSPMPQAIWLLGRYDVWDMSDKNEWEERILPFQYGFRAICNDLKSFPKGLLNNEPETQHRIEEIIKIGEQVMSYQAKQHEKMADAIAFEAGFKGFNVIAVNAGGINSKAFDSVYNPELHELMMTFVFTGKFWKISLYTTHDHIDCSDIAKVMGGGGHRKAAGFQVNELKDLALQIR